MNLKNGLIQHKVRNLLKMFNFILENANLELIGVESGSSLNNCINLIVTILLLILFGF